MELTLIRKFKKSEYTIGALYINNEYFCDTIEDTDRGLTNDMSLTDIKSHKIYGETAIPTGIYDISINIISPKFSSYSFYKKVCSGKLPRILNVKGFDGILIHVAEGVNGASLVKGCIGVGKNTIKGGLTNSKTTFSLLYKLLQEDSVEGNKITIKIM